ncbi:hypothetical protein R0137_04115 [Congregibacter brevis]|uniref:MFS transporter n=1 Tax=Congregibacter brevis TaxID=3081201 RepID=A0ABZ0IF44_9GAMM|nr:hypothetical protein R0137_04115 [Congregibacter sp. IMCC45268]
MMKLPQPAALFAILIGSLMFLYWLVMPVVMGSLADSRGYAEDSLGVLASLYAAGTFITTTSSMLWIQRANWVWLIRAGALISIAGFSVVLLDDSFMALALGHFVASLGLGISYAVVMALLGDEKQPARGYALVFFLQIVFGIAVSTLLTQTLEPVQILPTMAATMTGIGLLAMLLAGRLPTSSVKLATPELAELKLPRLPPWPIVLGLLAILLVFIGDAGIWIFLERIGHAEHSTEVGGLLVSVNLAAGAVGSLTAVFLSERWGYLWPMAIAIGLSVLSVAMFSAMGSVSILLAASFVNGWAWNFGAAYRMGLVSKLDRTGRFTVLIPSMQTLGNTLGPLMAGMLIVQGGYVVAFIVTALLWIAAFIAYYPAWRTFKSHDSVSNNA